MKIAYLGNFQPGIPRENAFSTESHVAASFELNGHSVTRIQEGETKALDVSAIVAGHDFFLHTQTYGYAVSAGTVEERFQMLDEIRAMGIPSVGYHLDKWWDLPRSDQVPVEPFFRVDLLCTADGGHDALWAEQGINHRWFPPGVFEPECEPVNSDPHFSADVAFVGSWRGGYHPEWAHRQRLVDFLRFRGGRFWPAHPQQPVRGRLLQQVYASTKIAVGDSCLVPNADGSPCTRYFSDRIPETLGRGCFLLHPWVEGVTDGTLYTDGEHLVTWPLGDFELLEWLIDYYLSHDDERRQIAEQGRAHVLANHTYTVRARQLIELMQTEGLLPSKEKVA